MDLSKIAKRTNRIDELSEKVKEGKGMLKAELENDENYAKLCEEVKELSEQKKALKEQILAQEENFKISMECEESAEELKTEKEILAVELVEYHHRNNSYEFVDTHGEKREFEIIARLKKKKTRHWDEDQPRDIEGKFAAE